MRHIFSVIISFGIVILAACTPPQPAAVVELDGGIPTATPRIVYVTPTQAPTLIATITLATAAPSATATPLPTNTPDFAEEQAFCSRTLTQLYTEASEACLGEPTGFFCNGGLAPNAQAVSNVSDINNTMAQQGSLVPVDVVAEVNTPPLLRNESGGLMWVRFDEPIEVNALLLGDVQLRDITPADSNLPEWQAMSVITDHAREDAFNCSTQPYSTFVAQGPWGRSTNFAINGVSVELTGSIAVQTHGDETNFLVLEGQAFIRIFGQNRLVYAGQQLNVTYTDGNFSQPVGVPSQATALDFDLIRNIPVPLLDRPILLPQSGFARTDGNVNMRAEPRVSSQLLAEVPDEQLMTIMGMNTERTWYHMRLPNGETGWMRGDLVTGDIGEVTITYDATPLPPERFGDARHTAVVVAPTGANLRRAPDVQFDVIRTLPEGTEVEILFRSPYSPFVQVDTGTEIGWLALITIETTTVIQFLPIDYDVPLPPGPTPTPFFAFGGGHAYPDPRGGN